MRTPTFDELLAEAETEPVAGWDFSWFAGRATEQRPPWGYQRMLTGRLAVAAVALDLQTGGGEVLAGALRHADPRPERVLATESWAPNLPVARANLRPFGATVLPVPEEAALPLAGSSVDLISSRHPTATRWDEVARVLRLGGRYLCQGIGSGSNRELTEAMMGPVPRDEVPRHRAAEIAAERAGLAVIGLRTATLRAEFHDIGAVAYFLRKVPWTVPGFTVDGYRDRLALLHERIRREGPFVAHAERFLLEALRLD